MQKEWHTATKPLNMTKRIFLRGERARDTETTRHRINNPLHSEKNVVINNLAVFPATFPNQMSKLSWKIPRKPSLPRHLKDF
jgi:hypothetical protein